MNQSEPYQPGPASGAHIEREGDNWTLVLVRQLRHSPEKVWAALTDPAQLREWAPFDVDSSMDKVGTVKLTWVGAPGPMDTKVTRVEPPNLLEYDGTRWQLEESGGGTRLTLWTKIPRGFISMGAAGWHIAFDVLDHLLGGTPIGRLSGPAAMHFAGWQRLNAEYAQLFGVAVPKWTPGAPKS